MLQKCCRRKKHRARVLEHALLRLLVSSIVLRSTVAELFTFSNGMISGSSFIISIKDILITTSRVAWKQSKSILYLVSCTYLRSAMYATEVKNYSLRTSKTFCRVFENLLTRSSIHSMFFSLDRAFEFLLCSLRSESVVSSL